ncbi:hypothetical protein [Streptacidiphilus sp. P02-A3a]|uniref:hypothetical protein n=1 Tax=Streptacidiphilus sp. P02-A3a TaxID=2704468 RepID=UPI0015FD9E90|nr:hypothetical protein [Streptacidiphilus sp. P02-A3a]QMU67626.1 hypothetical protein GXP74_04680 [Streptacidiphilus sp. P02-A3a]
MGTRRPLTVTTIAAGVGIAAAVALGPMASAATSSAARHDLRTSTTVTSAGPVRDLSLADTGADAVPYAVSGVGTLVVGAGLVYAARRWAS